MNIKERIVYGKNQWIDTLKSSCDTSYSSLRDDVISMHNNIPTSEKKPSSALLNALMAYARLEIDAEYDNAAIGTKVNGGRFAELKVKDDTRHAVFITDKGFIYASEYKDSINTQSAVFDLTNEDTTCILLALVPEIIADSEAKELYEQMKPTLLSDFSISEEEKVEFAKQLTKMTDNVYSRIVWHNTRVNINLTFNKSNKCYPISPSKIEDGTYIPDKAMGRFHLFCRKEENSQKNGSTTSMQSFMNSYRLNRVLTEKEQAMVPKFDDSWTVPKEAPKICRLIKQSSNDKEPFRNFMLQGPAGTGKTETASLIAAALGLPKVVVTCNADSELFDFVGQVLPDSGSEQVKDLPTIQEVCFQPAKSYERLTGKTYPETEVDQEELLMLLFNKVKKSSASLSGFHYTDTPFIQAFRNGWLVEIQEPTVISRPGVLPGLNALLEPNGSITLPTGEVIHRHPDTVVIMTTNKDYQGCEDMNQSVMSRMDMVFPVNALEQSEMEERTKMRSGLTDKNLLKQMVETVRGIATYLKKNDISGVCGMRELIAWAKAVRLEGADSVYDNALYCIIPKAADDEEEQEAIIDAYLKPVFAVD